MAESEEFGIRLDRSPIIGGGGLERMLDIEELSLFRPHQVPQCRAANGPFALLTDLALRLARRLDFE